MTLPPQPGTRFSKGDRVSRPDPMTGGRTISTVAGRGWRHGRRIVFFDDDSWCYRDEARHEPTPTPEAQP